MKVSQAIASRFSAREFLAKPVPDALVREIIERAGRAPSGGNLQPWRVFVAAGEARDAFLAAVAETRKTHPAGEGGEYEIYPPNLRDPYRARRYRVAEMLYESLGIAREDRAARAVQMGRNFDFFGAPVGMFFTIGKDMQQGQWADLGMFIMAIMLLAREYGLHTCPQEAWSLFSPSIKKFFDVPAEEMVFCGLALGWLDESAPVNQFRTERAALKEYAHFKGFEFGE